jgi:hypothetical protein
MAVAPFFGARQRPGKKEIMAETEREPQNNPLEDVAAAASDTLHGQTVSLTGSATRRIDAGQVKMQASSAGRIQAHAVHLENSATGMASAGSIETHDSALGFTLGREVHLAESVTPVVVAGKVEAGEVRTVLLAAGKVQGNVQAVFTIWSALAAGLGLGAALFGLGKVLSRRTPLPKASPKPK